MTAAIPALAAADAGMNLHSSITPSHPPSQVDADTPGLHPEEAVDPMPVFSGVQALFLHNLLPKADFLELRLAGAAISLSPLPWTRPRGEERRG